MAKWPDVTIETSSTATLKSDWIGRFLFVSDGYPTVPKLLDSSSDLTTLISDVPLRKILEDAQIEGGQGWSAYVVGNDQVPNPVEKWDESVERVQHLDFEVVVICDAIAAGTEIDAIKTAITGLHNKHIPVLVLGQLTAYSSGTYGDYATASAVIVNGKIADWFSVVAPIFGNELGGLAGRLSRLPVQRAAGRRKDGSVSVFPSKSSWPAGLAIADLKTMANANITVPHSLAGEKGTYFGNVHTLNDATTGFLYATDVRTYCKAERLVYKQGVSRLNDDEIETDEMGLSSFGQYCAKPVAAMQAAKECEGYAVTALLVGEDMKVDLEVWRKKIARSLKFNISLTDAPVATIEETT